MAALDKAIPKEVFEVQKLSFQWKKETTID